VGRETIYFSGKDGEFTGHISLTTPDAKFIHNGKPVIMSFHNYLGPFFEIVKGKELVEISPGEEPEYDNLWKQFYGWYEAKGKFTYK